MQLKNIRKNPINIVSYKITIKPNEKFETEKVNNEIGVLLREKYLEVV